MTLVSSGTLASSHTCLARVRPIPKMYVKLTHTCLSAGMFIPAIRAIFPASPGQSWRSPSALALFVPFVRADNAHDAVTPDHPAIATNFLD
jgi:hypothetical protein